MNTQVVLITGALTGIGRATAFGFAKEGARIVISGRHEEEGKNLVLNSATRRRGRICALRRASRRRPAQPSR